VIETPRAVRWHDGAVRIIDQTLLPGEFREIDLVTVDEIDEAIRSLRVRGAPAIGVAAALGLVASLATHLALPPQHLCTRLAEHAERLRAARPTAVNLGWAIDRLLARAARAARHAPAASRELWEALRDEALAILEEDRAMCRRIGEHGAGLLRPGATVLTHCNAGALATAGIGTALAPIYVALERGVRVRVLVTETRPLLQGARLTAWELGRAGVEVTVITDGMAAAVMRDPGVDLVLVGADRIAASGDVANKIGTYGLAIAARHHGVPFYVAAPSSTLDLSCATGAEIPIEQRLPDEVRSGLGRLTTPADAAVLNPAFDVTPAALIAGIITERGIVRPQDVGLTSAERS
jgi:methylthioribose-1-phosphate isomerase